LQVCCVSLQVCYICNDKYRKKMASITAFIRTSKDKSSLCKIRFRLYYGKNKRNYGVSNLTILSNDWDSKNQQIKSRVIYDDEKRSELNKSINNHKEYILDQYNQELINSELPKNWMQEKLSELYSPNLKKITDKEKVTFLEAWDLFINRKDISEGRRKTLLTTKNALVRFSKVKNLDLAFEYFNKDTIRLFEKYAFDEHKIIHLYPEVFGGLKTKHLPKEKSKNGLIGTMKKIHAFYEFCKAEKFTTHDAFDGFSIGTPVYGTPIYITKEERNIINAFDFKEDLRLATQRDIFIFQCLIGCRCGDLLRLKKNNIYNGVLSYIANKGKKEKPITIQVPLSKAAKGLVERYKDYSGENLFPFISSQKYNDAIKEVLKQSGINRIVAVYNPKTESEELRPINEIAASHMGRRTFIGNLFAKVKDQNIVGSMTGHSEGSKAFSRYRDINLDIKKEVIDDYLD